MTDIEISGLNPTPGLDLSDLLITKQGTQDYKATLEEIADIVIAKMTGTEALDKIKTVDTDTSGLNANTLQGKTAAELSNVRIGDNVLSASLSSTDQIPLQRAGNVTQYRTYLETISDYVNDDMDPSQILSKLLTVDNNSSGLNATTVGGITANALRDASNLAFGTVPDARLPNGIFSSTVTGSTSKYAIKFPIFMFGLQRIMIQFGNTSSYTKDDIFTTTFKESFASGITSNNTPLVIVGSEYVSGSGTAEMTINCRSSDLSSWTGGVSRVTGAGTDYVRANWIAIGKY